MLAIRKQIVFLQSNQILLNHVQRVRGKIDFGVINLKMNKVNAKLTLFILYDVMMFFRNHQTSSAVFVPIIKQHTNQYTLKLFHSYNTKVIKNS